MSNDKARATYYPDGYRPHTNTHVVNVNGHQIIIPNEPGDYDVIDGETGRHVAIVHIKKPALQVAGEWTGGTIVVAGVIAGLLIGARFLGAWLFGWSI